jgi:hypothetical protein
MVVGIPQVMFAAVAAVVTMPAIIAQRVMAFMFVRSFFVESAGDLSRIPGGWLSISFGEEF